MKLRIAILVFGLIIISIGEVYGADWKLYGSSEMYLSYYDAQSITHLSKNVVRVWTRTNLTEKGVLDMVEKFGKKFENCEHTIIFYEINCLEKTIRTLSMVFYDNKGGWIGSSSDPSSKWDFIIPESTTEGLYKEVCK